MNASLLDQALELAEQYPVFPCRENKKPATAHGFKDATQDPDQVQLLFGHPDAALIGVPTGKASGLVVIDCDSADATRWVQAHGLAATRTHHTRRGYHYLFNGDGIRNGTNVGGIDGLDVRGEGGYVIWWPAAGLAVVDNDLDRLRADQLPIASASAAAPANGFAQQLQGQAFNLGKTAANEGNRVSWLVRQVATMTGTAEEMNAEVRTLNQTCNPPLTDAELRQTVIPAIGRFHGKQKAAIGQPHLVAIPIQPLAEFLETAPAEPESYVGQWFRPGTYTVVSGREGLGKSVLVGELLHAVTQGAPLLQWTASVVPGRVLLVDGEMPPWILKTRYGHLNGSVDLLSLADGIAGSVDAILEADHKVVVFDNHATLFYMENENDSAEWRGVNQFMAALRNRGVAVVMVMHAAKGSRDMPGEARGSTAALQITDTVIRLRQATPAELKKAPFKEGDEDRHPIRVEWMKHRLGKAPKDEWREIASRIDDDRLTLRRMFE